VKHASYGTDASTTWTLWYSTNSGTSWTQVGGTITTASTTLQTATFTLSVSGPIRFEVRKTDGSTRRVNFDDFQVSGF
jgi:endonuclease G